MTRYSFRRERPTVLAMGRCRLRAVVGIVLLLAAAARAEEWARSDTEVALESTGHSWIVKATLNGRLTGTFLIDTGATFCVLTPDAAKRLHVSPSGDTVTLRTANGTVQVPRVELASVQVGGTRAVGVDAVVQGAVDPPLDGIIGLSFLNRFTYAIVPGRRVLRLH